MLKHLLLIAVALTVSTSIHLLLFGPHLYFGLVVAALQYGTGLKWNGWPMEMFFSNLVMAFVVGLGLALPFVVYQVRSLAMHPARTRSHRWLLPLTLPIVGLHYYVGVVAAANLMLPLLARSLFTLWHVPEGIQFDTYLRLAPLVLLLAGSVLATPPILIALARRSD